ncbi:hypothetical protein [Mesorhizobium sp.]|uniref:hypothetical protein n=1 Tax=Mesorhizobium sp. TaxID=1871066 RepID=UPI0025C36D71|nr:hypothetical protein [Mesorhizobium sp.]
MGREIIEGFLCLALVIRLHQSHRNSPIVDRLDRKSQVGILSLGKSVFTVWRSSWPSPIICGKRRRFASVTVGCSRSNSVASARPLAKELQIDLYRAASVSPVDNLGGVCWRI